MTRRFADFSRPVHHVSAGEAIGALVWMLAGIIGLLFLVWLVMPSAHH